MLITLDYDRRVSTILIFAYICKIFTLKIVLLLSDLFGIVDLKPTVATPRSIWRTSSGEGLQRSFAARSRASDCSGKASRKEEASGL